MRERENGLKTARVSLSGYIEEGDLSDVRLPDLLTVLDAGEQSGILVLSPREARLKVQLALAEGVVTAVKCAALPPFGADLVRAGVPRAALEAARNVDASTEGAVLALVRAGVLDRPRLAALLRRRALQALLMLQGLEARFQFVIEVSVPTYPGAGVRPRDLVTALERQLEAMRAVGADTVRATEAFLASAASAPSDVPSADARVLALLDGRPLWKIVHERGVAYPRLAEAVARLDAAGLAAPVRPEPASPPAPGGHAPRVVLQAPDEGRFTLGARRGGRTLLLFVDDPAAGAGRRTLRGLESAFPELRVRGIEPILVSRRAAAPAGVATLLDPDGAAARAWGVPEGLRQALRLRVLHRAPAALLAALRGRPLLAPSAFLVGPDLRIEVALRGRHAGAVPDWRAAAGLAPRAPRRAHARRRSRTRGGLALSTSKL